MSLSIPSEIAQRVHGLCPILGLQWNSARPTNVQDKNWDHRPIAIIPPRTVCHTREPVTLHRKVEEFVLYSSAREFLALVLRFVHSIGPI